MCIGVTMVLGACRNEDNIGDLFGQWQLVQYSENGVGVNPAAGSQCYISFEDHTAWVKSVDADIHDYQSVFASYEHRGDSLVMEFITRYGQSDSLLIEQILHFPSFSNSRFGVSKLDKESLILQSESKVWKWRKY